MRKEKPDSYQAYLSRINDKLNTIIEQNRIEAAEKERQRLQKEKEAKLEAERIENEKRRIAQEIEKKRLQAEAERKRLQEEAVLEAERKRLQAQAKLEAERAEKEKQEKEKRKKEEQNRRIKTTLKLVLPVIIATLGYHFFSTEEKIEKETSYKENSSTALSQKNNNKSSFKLINPSELSKQEQDGYWGLVDRSGQFVIPPDYLFAGLVFDDFSAVQYKNGKWGFININDPSKNIESKFDCVSKFSEGLAGVNVGGTFSEKRCEGGKWGFINQDAELVIPIYYQSVEPFKNGRSRVRESDIIGYINNNNQWIEVVKTIEPSKYSFNDGLAKFKFGDKYGFINQQGSVTIPPQYTYAGIFSEGYAAVRNDEGKWGFIDKQGGVAITFKYDCASRFKEGFVGVNIGGQWEYSEKPTCTGGKWGFIDTEGDYLKYEPIFDSVRYFDNGYADVIYQGIKGTIDRYGNYEEQ